MGESDATDDRADLVSRMFALLTGKFEDAATIAADCQGKRPFAELREGAFKLREMMSEVATVIDSTIALLDDA